MKAEINQRIAALLENPEIETVRVEVRTAFEVYRDAREKDVAVQRAVSYTHLTLPTIYSV